VNVSIRAIDAWTDPPTPGRKRSQFRASESNTMKLLESELRLLGAKFGVIELVMGSEGLKLDGGLRAKPDIKHPGVVLHLESRHGPLRYACDTYTSWQENLRAIALGLEALRAVDRYGIARRGEQYRGWAQLPPGEKPFTRSEAERIIRNAAGEAYGTTSMTRAIRAAIRSTHPDAGGDPDVHREVIRARDVIESESEASR
jgi:hypothetical protein